MRILGVHPSALMYTEIYLRLEPLGLELVAEALRRAGHEVRLLDLQVETHDDYFTALKTWRPDAVAFSLNYLANIPETVDLAKATKELLPRCFVFVGGHSASFVARDIICHAEGAIDCVLKGEAEASVADLVAMAADDPKRIAEVAGVVTGGGEGPPPKFAQSLDDLRPARDLLRHRKKYFIGVLDPCASIEFSRGCPWDCVFCSAWTFYGRNYRLVSPERAVDDLSRVKEAGVFIVDDVAFIHASHGFEIGEAIARKGIRKQYYLETRGDVLLRNKEVFKFWKNLGMKYMFLGLEAIDQDGLRRYRKRASLGGNFEALEFARSLGIKVAINIIADPDWDRERFRVVREFCQEIPEIVNISVATPYPGTELWHTESRRLTTRDYRLFDIQHAVLPTRLPLEEFYRELVNTQQVLNRKHLGWNALKNVARIGAGHLLRGQTNFVRMLWKFNSIYNPARQCAEHERPVQYEIRLPPSRQVDIDVNELFVYQPQGEAQPGFIMRLAMRQSFSVAAILMLCGSASAAAVREDLAAGYDRFYNLEYPQAIVSFEKAAAEDPMSPIPRNGIAQSVLYREMLRNGALDSEMVDSSNSFLRRPKMAVSKDSESRFTSALNKALELSQQQLNRNPRDLEALHARAVSFAYRSNWDFLVHKDWHASLGDATASRKMEDRILAIDPRDPDAPLGRGVHEYIIGGLPWALRTLGMLAGLHGDKARGLAIIEGVAKCGTLNRADAELLLCAFYRRERTPEKALPLLAGLIQRYPRNYILRFEQAKIYGDTGDALRALAAIDDIEKLKTSGLENVPWSKIYYERATIQFWYSLTRESLANFKKVLATPQDLNTNGVVLSYMREGQILDMLNDHGEAIESYRKAIAYAPGTEAADESRRYISTPYRRPH